MEKLQIEGTGHTLKVDFNPSDGLLNLEGKSLPENADKFFTPLINWIKDYSENPADSTTLVMNIDYLNTASTKFMFTIFLKLENLKEQGHNILAKWYYADDDEDMQNIGEEFDDVVNIPFELISYELED